MEELLLSLRLKITRTVFHPSPTSGVPFFKKKCKAVLNVLLSESIYIHTGRLISNCISPSLCFTMHVAFQSRGSSRHLHPQ